MFYPEYANLFDDTNLCEPRLFTLDTGKFLAFIIQIK